MLYNIVLASTTYQYESATGIHIPSVLNPPPISRPVPPLEVVTEHYWSKFSLAIYFTYGDIYVSVLFSQSVPLLPSPTVSTSVSSNSSVSPLLPCKQVHLYSFAFSMFFSIFIFFRLRLFKLFTRVQNLLRFLKLLLPLYQIKEKL